MNATPRWQLILAGVAVPVALLLLVPQLPWIRSTPALVLLAVGLVGFLCRWRVLDAALLVGMHVVAQLFVEPLAGPLALAIPCLLVLGLTGRTWLALWAGAAVLGSLLISIELKQRFAGSPLTWQDLRYFFKQFNDNVAVLASQPTLILFTGLALVVVAGISWLVWRLEAKPPSVEPTGRQRRWTRIARIAAVLASFGFAYELDLTSKPASQRSMWGISEISASMRVSTFFSTRHLEPVAQFERLDSTAFARQVEELRAKAIPARRPADIVVILQESQFNPMAVAGCPADLCQGPAFLGDSSTTDDGELRVHVTGGGTWLSEFTLLTAVPHTVYGAAGQYASFNIAPGVQRSLVRSLKASGYHTVAVYPVRGGMMNARSAYGAYGFDEFLDAADLGLSGAFDTPDDVMHQAALKVLGQARRHGKPVFLLALTIANHSEHGLPSHPVPDSMLARTRAAFGDKVETRPFADYLFRTRAFEAAWEKTRKALLGGPQPTVLAWFGDHLPPFGNASRLRSAIKGTPQVPAVNDLLLTWYNVSSNLPQQANDRSRHRLDIVFLPGLLAQRAGAPMDDWLAANVLARQRCAGLLVECAEPGLRDTYMSFLLDRLQAIQ